MNLTALIIQLISGAIGGNGGNATPGDANCFLHLLSATRLPAHWAVASEGRFSAPFSGWAAQQQPQGSISEP